ncbi:MAG: YeeE/YedE family protein [Myxococcales bacterium]|nr:YeeE/YedE family protein [Myxococcales bacterium]
MLSGMTDPARVIGFLDLAAWDPTLMFVMGGALLVTTPTFLLSRRRARPVLDATFHPPTKTAIEPRLVGGAALFGVGWGLVGLCPGPALTSLATGRVDVLLFVVAMIASLWAVRRWDLSREAPSDTARGAATSDV